MDDMFESEDDLDELTLFEDGDSGSDDLDITDDSSDNDVIKPDDSVMFSEIGEEKEGKSVKKVAVVLIAVGIVVVLVATSIGIAVSKKSKKSTKQISKEETTQQDSNYVKPVKSTENNGWKTVSSEEDVNFNSEYTSLTFTITGINHVARKNGENIEIKTLLNGSVSGLSGTYELEVPYNKGIKTSIGMSFDIECLMGEYQGAVVIGDIKIK